MPARRLERLLKFDAKLGEAEEILAEGDDGWTSLHLHHLRQLRQDTAEEIRWTEMKLAATRGGVE